MTLFIAICSLLALMTIVWLVRPLLRTTSAESGDDTLNTDTRSAQNLVIARDRLDELDVQRQAGVINDDDYNRERSNVESALATQINLQPAVAPQGRSVLLTLLLVVSIPALSVWLYTVTGTPEAMDPVHQIASQQPTTREGVESMVDSLAKRMANDPDNVQGWYRLAQSFMVLQRYPEALDAMQNIQRIEGDTPEVLSMFGQGYMIMGRYEEAVSALRKLRQAQGDTPETLLRQADAMAMQQNAQLSGEPEKLVLKALASEPLNVRALWMAGMAARQQQNNTQALEHWDKLVPLLTDQPANLEQLNTLIADARADMGTAPSVSMDPATESTSPTAGGSADMSADAATVTVSVSLEDRLRVRAKPDETVFIFARAVGGPRMPLAAHKTTVGALPLTITLSDADAMTPQMTLSSVDEIQIVARVSRQGQPVPKPGDLEGISQAISLHTNPSIVLVIDKILE